MQLEKYTIGWTSANVLCRYAVQIVKPLVSKNKSEKLTIGTVNCNVLITSSCIVEENTKSRSKLYRTEAYLRHSHSSEYTKGRIHQPYTIIFLMARTKPKTQQQNVHLLLCSRKYNGALFVSFIRKNKNEDYVWICNYHCDWSVYVTELLLLIDPYST
ncbi:hypothetical protein BCV71DRAFT_238112 [Rhizopus microsporus]|uniref:Uncharacterized protein n=1 Tax=Rhizopus microsporus TaxID=58291 RepID=A0A1X0RS02_RHIZD|nr:hypothetical protein BCV71DRAFT_238112 [Rhizopus microsporus]